eukprot:Awhi_evm1s15492
MPTDKTEALVTGNLKVLQENPSWKYSRDDFALALTLPLTPCNVKTIKYVFRKSNQSCEHDDCTFLEPIYTMPETQELLDLVSFFIYHGHKCVWFNTSSQRDGKILVRSRPVRPRKKKGQSFLRKYFLYLFILLPLFVYSMPYIQWVGRKTIKLFEPVPERIFSMAEDPIHSLNIKDVSKAFRDFATKNHPDLHSDSPDIKEIEEKFAKATKIRDELIKAIKLSGPRQ